MLRSEAIFSPKTLFNRSRTMQTLSLQHSAIIGAVQPTATSKIGQLPHQKSANCHIKIFNYFDF